MNSVRRAWQGAQSATRAGLVLALLLVALIGGWVQIRDAQPAARFAQTGAIVDDGTLQLDDYRRQLHIDMVEGDDGEIAGDKAPLQPLLATVPYAVGRTVGAEPAHHQRIEANLGVWWVTLWSAMLPFGVLAFLGVRLASRLVSTRVAVAATTGILTGSLLIVFATRLYGHVLAALLGWGCWLVVADRAGSRRAALAGGALAGAAVATEYPMVIVVVAVAGALAVGRRWRDLKWFVAGGLPFAALVAAWNWALFDNPFTVSYAEKAGLANRPAVAGLPTPEMLLRVLVGNRGLVTLTPVLVIAAWGLVHLARGRKPRSAPADVSSDGGWRTHGVVGLVVLGGFIALQAGWPNPSGGDTPGARYVIPALPFLIPGLAAVWRSEDRLRWLATRWSQITSGLAVVALYLVDASSMPPLVHLYRLIYWGPEPTLWTLATGPIIGNLLTVVWVGGLVALGCRWWRGLDDGAGDPAPAPQLPGAAQAGLGEPEPTAVPAASLPR